MNKGVYLFCTQYLNSFLCSTNTSTRHIQLGLKLRRVEPNY